MLLWRKLDKAGQDTIVQQRDSESMRYLVENETDKNQNYRPPFWERSNPFAKRRYHEFLFGGGKK